MTEITMTTSKEMAAITIDKGPAQAIHGTVNLVLTPVEEGIPVVNAGTTMTTRQIADTSQAVQDAISVLEDAILSWEQEDAERTA